MMWHSRQDRPALLAHNRRLSARIIEGAEALGLGLVSPREADQRGGSVMLRLPDTRLAKTVLEAFRTAGVYADARGQVLRLSPGFMTTDAGTDHMLTVLAATLR